MKRYLMAGSVLAGMALFGACMGLAPGARADMIYNYVFSPGAGYSGNGDTAFLSGTFSWDATNNTIVASNINLTGTDVTGSHPAAVSCSNCSTGIYDTAGAQYFAINLGNQALYTTYANSLDLNAVDPLVLSISRGNQAEYQGGQPFTSATDGANPVPAPLIGHGLLVFLAAGGILFGAKFCQRSRNPEAAA